MSKGKHKIYTGHDARGRVLLKCRCLFETVKDTEAHARKAHADATKAVA